MTESLSRAFLFHRESIDGGSPISAAAARRTVSAWRLRAALIVGCAIAIGLAGYLGDATPFTHSDPPLAQLLRGMALIKGAIAIAIAAAVWWRFGRPVTKRVATGYLGGSWILMGSTTLIWQLSWIPLAAILFHAAALSLLVLSWRER